MITNIRKNLSWIFFQNNLVKTFLTPAALSQREFYTVKEQHLSPIPPDRYHRPVILGTTPSIRAVSEGIREAVRTKRHLLESFLWIFQREKVSFAFSVATWCPCLSLYGTTSLYLHTRLEEKWNCPVDISSAGNPIKGFSSQTFFPLLVHFVIVDYLF